MAKCATCGKFLSTKGGATCGNITCHNKFHLTCLPAGTQIGSDWQCQDCRNRSSRVDDDTPVRGLGSGTPAIRAVAAPDLGRKATQTQGTIIGPPTAAPIVISRAESEQGTDGDHSPDTQLTLREEIRLFRSELREVRDEMREFRREMASLHSTVGICTERVDSLEARIVALESRNSVALPDARVSQLERNVAGLQLELNDREQDLLGSDIEVANVPEIPGENVVHTVGLLAAKLGVALEARDIVFAQRVGPRVDRVLHATAAGATSPAEAAAVAARGRRIVVRLARRTLRDELLQGARVRRGATTADTGLPAPPRRFFVNERLTRTNKQLFFRVREAGSRLGWRYLWTKNGRILAKQGDGKPTHWIRKEEDIGRVFGQEMSAERDN